MRKTQVWMIAAILISGILASCTKKKETVVVPEEQVEVVVDTLNPLPEYKFIGRKNYVYGIFKYLLDSINPGYTKGELCIPLINVVKADATNSNDIKVWGEFWVDNYKLVDNTLMNVSGGSHPGLFHVKLNDDGSYQVTSFEAVADGSDFTPSAKRIFGDKFEAFQSINSDDKGRNEVRLTAVANYVKAHDLKATQLKDYERPAVELPLK